MQQNSSQSSQQNEIWSTLAEINVTVSAVNSGQSDIQPDSDTFNNDSGSSQFVLLNQGGTSAVEFKAEQISGASIQRTWTQTNVNKGHFMLKCTFVPSRSSLRAANRANCVPQKYKRN